MLRFRLECSAIAHSCSLLPPLEMDLLVCWYDRLLHVSLTFPEPEGISLFQRVWSAFRDVEASGGSARVCFVCAVVVCFVSNSMSRPGSSMEQPRRVQDCRMKIWQFMVSSSKLLPNALLTAVHELLGNVRNPAKWPTQTGKVAISALIPGCSRTRHPKLEPGSFQIGF